MKSLDSHLLKCVQDYLERHYLSGRRFGSAALGDPGLVAGLKRGRSLRLDTADRVLVFMGEAPIGPVFRREVEAFLAITRTKVSVLGLNATGNPSFVQRLRGGASPRLATVDRVRAWMADVCTAAEAQAIAGAVTAGGRTATIVVAPTGRPRQAEA